MVKRPARLENDLGGFGIVVDVGFGRGVDVAAGDRASHEDDFFDQGNDGGIFENGQRDVGQRPDRNQRDLMRRGVHHLDDEVRPEARIHFAFAGRQFDVGQTILAVPELGRDELLKERMLRPGGDRNVAAVGERNHPQRILQALTGGHVSGDHGDGAHIQFGRIQRQHQGQGVVGTGIGVENDLLGRRRGRERSGEQIRSRAATENAEN